MGYAARLMEIPMRQACHRWLAVALTFLLPTLAFASIPKNNRAGNFWSDQWKAADRFMLPPHVWSWIIASVAILGTLVFAVLAWRRPKAVAAPTAPDWTNAQAKKWVGWTLFFFLALYALGFNGSFSVYDDPQNIWLNDVVKYPTWKSLYEIIWDNHRAVNQEWMFLSLFTSFRLAGKEYWVFFISNWLMLPLLLGLVYRLGHELFQNKRVAWLGMVFMGLSPILAEIVCWMLTRGHYFGIIFAVAACTTYLAYMRTSPDDRRRRLMLYVMAALFYASSQFGKPIFVYVPLWLIFFDVFRRRRAEWMPLWTVLVPLAVLGLDQLLTAPLTGWLTLSVLEPAAQTALAIPDGATLIETEQDSDITSAQAITMSATVLWYAIRVLVAGALIWLGDRWMTRQRDTSSSVALAATGVLILAVLAAIGIDQTVIQPILDALGERLAGEDATDIVALSTTMAGWATRVVIGLAVVGLALAPVRSRLSDGLRSTLTTRTFMPLFVADKVVFVAFMVIFLQKIIEGGSGRGRVAKEWIGGSFSNTLALNANHVLGYLHSAFIPFPTGLRTPWNEPANWIHVTGIPDIFVNGFSPLASLLILICLAACGLILALRYRWGMLLLAGVGAVVSIGPVANIPVHTVVHAYRYTLSMNVLVSITLGAAAVHIYYNTRHDWVKRVVTVATIGWLSLGMFHTIGNIRAWRQPVHLWTRSADVLYPNDGWSHYYAAKTLQHKRRYHEALAHAHIAIDRIPKNTMANRRIGDAYYSMDEYPSAAIYWEKYFKSHRSKITESYSKKLARVGLERMVPRKHREAIQDVLDELAAEAAEADSGSDVDSGARDDGAPEQEGSDNDSGERETTAQERLRELLKQRRIRPPGR